MAGLNILSQTPLPWQLSAPSTSSSLSYSLRFPHFYIYNLGDYKCWKTGSTNLPLSGNPKSKRPPLSCQMLPHISNSSGSGYSWMQDKSASCDNFSPNGRKQGPLKAVSSKERAQVSSVDDLYDFICSGPLIDKIGLTAEKVAESIDEWIEYGLRLCRLFQLNQLALNEAQKIRIYHYYIPVFFWCEQEISQHSSKFKEEEEIPPLVIGFSAPQGCGKTTLVFALEYLFKITGRKAATLSIDDFYLTAEEQAKLRDSNPGNLLLEVILFEGWMLGFKPLPPEVVKAVDPQLETVNKNLEAYYDAWHKYVKSWIVIKIQDPSYVYQWRLQAEIAMRADGKPGMSDEEVKDFVSRYLPAYKAYLPTLYSEGPSGSDPEHVLLIDIDEGRNPILGC